MRRGFTKYKIRHYRPDPDGLGDVLLFAQSADKTMYQGDGENDQIFRGSKDEIEIRNDALWTPNALADEGEVDILSVYFDAVAVRTNFYLGLTTTLPVEADTLAAIDEHPVQDGYSRKVVARGSAWTLPTAGGGTTSDTVTWTATATWTAVTDLFLTDGASGTSNEFLAWATLSATRSLLNLDTLDADMTVSLE